jgi:hypothetical protein
VAPTRSLLMVLEGPNRATAAKSLLWCDPFPRNGPFRPGIGDLGRKVFDNLDSVQVKFLSPRCKG